MPRVLKSHQYLVDEKRRQVVRLGDEADGADGQGQNHRYDDEGRRLNRETLVEVEEFVDSMMDKARRGAEIIIEKASSKASAILAEAQNEAEGQYERVEREAYEKGFAQGVAEGKAEGTRLHQEADKALEEAKRRRQEIIDSVERELVELIAKLMNKLLANTLEIHPGIITVLAKSALSGLHTAGDVVLHISPEDYEDVTAKVDEIQAVVDASCKLEFFKDTSLKAGECIIGTAYGTVDVSLDQAYRSLVEDLHYLYKSGELVEGLADEA